MWLWVDMLTPVIAAAIILLTIRGPYSLIWLVKRGALGIGDAVPYDYLAADGIIACVDNRLIVTWRIEGPDLANMTYADAAAKIATWNHAASLRDEAWAIYFHDFREETVGYPDGGAAPDPTTATMAWSRRRRYNSNGRQFRNRVWMSVAFRPPSAMLSAIEKMVLDRRLLSMMSQDDQYMRAMQRFEAQLGEFESGLKPILKMRRVKGRVEEVEPGVFITVDEQVQFLNRVMTFDDHEILRPPNGDVRRILTSQDLTGGWWPRVGDKYVAVIQIEDTPNASSPGQLDQALSNLRHTYLRATRLIFLSNDEAQRRAKGSYYRNKDSATSMLSKVMQKAGAQSANEGMVDPAAEEAAKSSQEAYGNVSRGDIKHVIWNSKVILMHKDLKELNAAAEDVKKCIQNARFAARIEHLNAAEGWVAMLPGEIDHDLSPLMIDTINAGDLSSLGSTHPGSPVNPNPLYVKAYHDRFGDACPPLIRMLTHGASPYDFTPAVTDVAHMLLVGPTGSGKSTAFNGLIYAQFAQFPESTVYLFDQGRSAERYCLASGGRFYNMDPAHADFGFCPLAEIDDEGERNWAAEWILKDLLEPQGLHSTPMRQQKVRNALNILAHQAHRSLSVFQHLLRVTDPEAADALQYFTVEGPMRLLLDSESDDLSSARFQVFEMQQLLQMKNELAVVPVLHYIFHRIEQRMNGVFPSIIALDESPDYLRLPTFAKSIRGWLDKFRKKNCGVWLTTLKIADFIGLEIAHTIVDACKTKIFLANPAAGKGPQLKMHMDVGCTEEDILRIAGSTEKTHAYIMQGDASRAWVTTDFDPVELEFIGASNPSDVRETAHVYPESGKMFGREMLRRRGLMDAVAHWDQEAVRLGWLDDSEAVSPVRRVTDEEVFANA